MSFKKRWERELSSTLPSLDEKTKNMPIPRSDTVAPRKRTLLNLPRIPMISAAVTALLIVALIPVLLLGTRGGSGGGGNDGDDVFFGKSMITLEINPSITLITDENGIVTGLKSANSDGDLMVASADFSDRVIGKTIGEATLEFISEAHALGFTNDVTEVKITTYEGVDNKATAESLERYIKEHAEGIVTVTSLVSDLDFFAKNGLPAESVWSDLVDARALFLERNLTDDDTEALRVAYESTLNHNEIRDMLTEKYNNAHASASSKRVEFSTRVDAIRAKNEEIKELSPFSFDYFLYEFSGIEITDAKTATAVAEMREMLGSFKDLYGIEIINLTMLDAIVNIYEDFESLGIYEMILDLDLSSLSGADEILKKLNQYGEDTSDIEDILTPPLNLEQFNQKYVASLKTRYEELKSKNSK